MNFFFIFKKKFQYWIFLFKIYYNILSLCENRGLLSIIY